MNLRDLTYLIAVAKYRHFGKAAQACFVSQPTLSTQIKKLEEELGVILIERNNKQVLLTEIGEQIVSKVEAILKNVDDVRQMAENYKDPGSGTLSLAAIPTLGPYLLPHIMAGIQAEFPKMQPLLYELQTAEILKRLESGEIDAALLALPIEHMPFVYEPLFEEPFLAAVPAGNPLAKKKQLQLSNIAEEKVLLLEDGHCLRNQALDICRMIDAHEFEGFRATSLETLRQMVASGVGATLIPMLATLEYASRQTSISYIPFEPPAPSRQIVLAYRGTYHRIALLQRIAELIREKITPLLH
jgi:LysR family hydrogen peroxide-inducible transcriptional activator